jgi:hypothetical protein
MLVEASGHRMRLTGRQKSRMRSIVAGVCGLLAAALFTGCETPLPPGVERGPSGTVAYDVAVEATEPGAKIEFNGETVGSTPLNLKIFGDRDGTFHNFGSYEYVIRALPLVTNQFDQIRVFRTGDIFMPEDRIPQKIVFDMNQKTPVYQTAPGGYYGAPYYPYPYYPYPYYRPYYGPSFYFYSSPYYYHGHGHHAHGHR